MSCQNVYYFTTFLFLCQDFFKVFSNYFQVLNGAGSGNRTHLSSLEGWSISRYTIPAYYLFLMVGVTGIEPATSWSQTTRAPICATPREHLVSLDKTFSLSQRQGLFYNILFNTSTLFCNFFYFFHFNSSIKASTG